MRMITPLRALAVMAGVMAAAIASAQGTPEYRAVYVPTFSTNSATAANRVIDDILASNINSVFVQVRSRADAYYIPNRDDSTYPNTEPRGQLWTITPADLDILQLYIDRLHNATPPREVHAWLTTYNSWNSTTRLPASPNHVLNRHPEWVTENRAGVTYTAEDDAPLDPGIPAVQDYLYNVFMDVVRNYDIDGIQFDYVRLLASNSGFDPVAKERFRAETGWDWDTENTSSDGQGQLEEAYKAWRRDQISRLVQRVHRQTMLEKPWVEVSAFLVNFSDSVEVLGQGYNWWVANGAIDVLHPGCYASTVSATIDDWNFYVNKLAQNGDQFRRPMVAALGSYLMLDTATTNDQRENLDCVLQLRGNARRPDGFNFFAYAALFRDGGTPINRLALDLFGTGGPMSTWVPVPAMAHKIPLGEETIPPLAPAQLAATTTGGIPTVRFNRPAAATDGDLPVRYRLYRSTTTPVPLTWGNLVMEWWDPGSPRTAFAFEDTTAPAGNVHYAAVAYDDWNNRAIASIGPVTVGGGDYIIETVAGGLNVADYTEAGTFTTSTSHSTAPGLTAGIGSRFALPGDANGRNDRQRFMPSGVAAGEYEVQVTCFGFGSANALGITVRLSDATGVRTSTFNLTNAVAGNKWAPVGTMTINPGAGHFVEFDNSTQTNVGDSTNSRMNAAAVRFVRLGRVATPRERKPAVVAPPSTFPVGGAIIVDSHPTALHYDDRAGTSGWADAAAYTGYYNSNARFYPTTSYPMDDHAMWIVDLPRRGRWAIDGWVRRSPDFATGARYRFVDADGVVRNSQVTQSFPPNSTTVGDWFINVDGVPDAQAYTFNSGRVYVTLWGNAGGTQIVIADALRFRLIEALDEAPPPPEPHGWLLN